MKKKFLGKPLLLFISILCYSFFLYFRTFICPTCPDDAHIRAKHVDIIKLTEHFQCFFFQLSYNIQGTTSIYFDEVFAVFSFINFMFVLQFIGEIVWKHG